MNLPHADPEQVDLELARKSLLRFTQRTFNGPYQTNWHHRVLCDVLDDFADGKIPRLMVFMPPRHSKSEHVSRRLPAFLLGRDPDTSIIATSYSADLAARMNRDVQRIMDSDAYRRIFPGVGLSGGNVRTAAQWSWLRNSDIFEIVGRRGVYRSAGVGGGITGMGASWAIIDDPIKNMDEAESPVYRRRVKEWYDSTLYTRLEKNGAVLITVTRWHEDDLAGRLLDIAGQDGGADTWEVLSLKAIADEDRHPLDERETGEALWPGKKSLADLEKIKASVGPRVWNALYQQGPTAEEGGMFRKEDFTITDAAPVSRNRVRYWDRAATEGDGDWTVGTLISRAPDGLFFVEDVERGQWGPDGVERAICATASQDGQGVQIVLEEDPGQAGRFEASYYVRRLAGYDVRCTAARQNKITRAIPYAAQCRVGNVRLVRGPWNREWIAEHCGFPNGKHDDQVDSAGGAFRQLVDRPADEPIEIPIDAGMMAAPEWRD